MNCALTRLFASIGDSAPESVHADLFDDDLTAVADRLDESVGKLWARRAISGL